MSHPLRAVRDFYLDGFRKAIARQRTRLDQFTTELLLEVPSLQHPEYCYRLYRADIVGKRDGKPEIVEVIVGAREARDWQQAFPSVVSVDAPLVWHGIEFDVVGGAPDERELVTWTSRWLDVSDNRYDKSAEFQHVVHSITPPTVTDSGFTISVDFGSAPTAAFDELAQLLARDVSSVSVGSFFLFRGTT